MVAGNTNKFIENEVSFQMLVRSIKDYAIFMIDLEGRVSSWNAGAEHIKGYTAGEIIGRHISTFYTPEEIQGNEPEENLRLTRESGSYETEGWRRRKDGSLFFANVVFTALFDAGGNHYGYAKVTKDITEKKEAEEKMRLLAAIANNIHDPVISADNNFLITRWNAAAENLLEWKSEEVVGKTTSEILDVVYPDKTQQEIRQSFAEKGFWEGEVIYHTKSGRPVNVLVTASHLLDVKGIQKGNLVLVRDITERKKSEKALNQLNIELEAFTYSVSHDLRAPLRGIVGFTSILEEEYGDKLDQEGQRITGIIRNNTMKMGQLIDDLLNFSRISKQEIIKSSINMNALVSEVIAAIEYPNKKTVWETGDLPDILGDINTIRQVWVNLLSNAVKYSSRKEEPRISIGYSRKGKNHIFSVRDNGVGFDQKYHDKLFRVFQRLHSQSDFEGTGVGLAIVEKIISRHGGNVWAEGTLNEGATFNFLLPGSN